VKGLLRAPIAAPRRQKEAASSSSSTSAPAITGADLSLDGSRCVLTGVNALQLLGGDAFAAVSDLTLAHMSYEQVHEAVV
jgi:hypothetical protein